MALSLGLGVALATTGCVGWPLNAMHKPDAREHLNFLTRAMTADPPAREALWRASLAGSRTVETQLHKALLQSVPGHAGYDPAAAENGLKALLDQEGPADVAAVARLRLAEMKMDGDCHTQVEALKQRLSKVADIERKLNRNGQ